MCVYVVYAFFECSCLYLVHMPARRDRGWPNRIKNRKSGNQPKFRFRLIRNRNDLSKFRFRSIRNRIGKLKIRFRLIRTEILLRKSGSGFLKPHSGRPLKTGVVSVSVKIYLSDYCYALKRCGLSTGTVPVNNLFHLGMEDFRGPSELNRGTLSAIFFLMRP